jgi:hypothetical protein
MGAIGTIDGRVIDGRAAAMAPLADARVAGAWREVGELAVSEAPEMGLLAGERPAADVELLTSLAASAEYELARRMVLAEAAGGLPLPGPGAMLRARGWSPGSARRLMAAGQVAVRFPAVAEQWAAGVITAEHAAAIERHRGRLSDAQLEVALRGFEGRWGGLAPRAVGEVIAAVAAALYPPGDPSPDELAAYEARHLSFALTGDTVLLTGTLPRLEGEALLAVIDAFAESVRESADHVPAAARRADGLMAMAQVAAARGAVPMRGGLPVALTVTLSRTDQADVVARTSRGHRLTRAELRFACCDPTVTPVLIAPNPGAAEDGTADHGTARILAIAEALLRERVPLAVGRTSRTASAAQRRALAIRDRGCIIPGCGIPAEICQVHHVHEWAAGGTSDLDNEVLLCWAHHRQVDLRMWRIEPAKPGKHPPGSAWISAASPGWIITRQPRSRWRL